MSEVERKYFKTVFVERERREDIVNDMGIEKMRGERSR